MIASQAINQEKNEWIVPRNIHSVSQPAIIMACNKYNFHLDGISAHRLNCQFKNNADTNWYMLKLIAFDFVFTESRMPAVSLATPIHSKMMKGKNWLSVRLNLASARLAGIKIEDAKSALV